MTPVDEIFTVFGNSPTQLARAIKGNVKTVSDWKRLRPIPHWWRPTVLDAVRAKGATLSPTALSYLGDTGAAPTEAVAA